MLLLTLEAFGFRNLQGKISFSRGLNVLVGENGQGKTNWIEAISLLASTRSFRTTKLVETVRFGDDVAMVQGLVEESPEISRTLSVTIKDQTKTLQVNNKKETVQNYLTQLHAVVFEAGQLDIVRGYPDARRRFLDAGIVSLHPPFIQTFTDYSRVIKQKNALLQNARDKGDSVNRVTEMLAPWNEQLATLATRIHKARVRFVERLNGVLEKRLFAREELSIRYVSSLEEKGDLSDYEALIRERLAIRVQAELVSGHALIGTHRDDLEIDFDGHELRKFGSAGQQRSGLLLLQLANLSVYHATRGEYPLFLLDDIDAELDYTRIGHLLEYLEGKTQTFVTTSKESFVEKFATNASVFRVTDGTAKPL